MGCRDNARAPPKTGSITDGKHSDYPSTSPGIVGRLRDRWQARGGCCLETGYPAQLISPQARIQSICMVGSEVFFNEDFLTFEPGRRTGFFTLGVSQSELSMLAMRV